MKIEKQIININEENINKLGENYALNKKQIDILTNLNNEIKQELFNVLNLKDAANKLECNLLDIKITYNPVQTKKVSKSKCYDTLKKILLQNPENLIEKFKELTLFDGDLDIKGLFEKLEEINSELSTATTLITIKK